MAASRNKPAETEATTDEKAAQADPDVQAKVDAIEEQGFIGVKVDPLPNSAYSLESGPDSPGILEAHQAFLDANRHDKK